MTESAIDPALLHIAPNEFRLFRELIYQQTGIFLREGKEIMLASRLARRLRKHHMSDFAEYYDYVRGCGPQSPEMDQLINCVTTNKTSFFRERHHFTFLSETAVAEILSRRGTNSLPPAAASGDTVNIWSAACSAGEEAYSIAITLLEAQLCRQGRFVRPWETRIFASDIDTAVLAKAALGVYGNEELEDIEPELRTKYFLRGKGEMEGCFKVKPQVRSLVQFARINLMDSSWPLKTMFDVIFFRNALIYFKHETQDMFLRKIIRHLKPRGYLILGHSEHIPWLHDILEPLQKTVYRLRSGRA